MRTLLRYGFMLIAIALLLGGWAVQLPVAHATPLAPFQVATEEFTVTLGEGWRSAARLTYPAGQPGPFPTVVLLVNPDVSMDFLAPPVITEPIYQDLAETLSAQGIAVVRYNPRYVNGAGSFADPQKVFAQTPPDMLADAERVVAAARTNPRVDQRRLFVFGWSYSSLAAAALAARDPGLAGLILVGPISATDRQLYIEDYTDVVLPYLLRYAPDGQIGAAALEQAQAGDGGTLAKGLLGFAFIDGSVTDRVVVSPFFDTDGNGVLDLNAEILPRLGAWVDADPFVASTRLLPSVYEQATHIQHPVLVLQGEQDASTRVRNTRGLSAAFASHPDFTLMVYPGVGHSLSPNSGLIFDRLRRYSEQPKADLVAWVLAHSPPTPAALPNTAGEERDLRGLIALAAVLLLLGAIARRWRAA